MGGRAGGRRRRAAGKVFFEEAAPIARAEARQTFRDYFFAAKADLEGGTARDSGENHPCEERAQVNSGLVVGSSRGLAQETEEEAKGRAEEDVEAAGRGVPYTDTVGRGEEGHVERGGEGNVSLRRGGGHRARGAIVNGKGGGSGEER